ncbi:MAG: hypothetical protein EB116_06610 [Betaproteobacteria bacterium]|nr:hypothetical protein [Betaproteobacteria bacterium]
MENANYYIILNNIVTNIIVANEEYGRKYNLRLYPIFIPNLGIVNIGWTYLPKEDTFLPPPRDILSEWAKIRSLRDSLLVESDMYVAIDRWKTYNQDKQEAFFTYREKLRNIPQDFTDPSRVVWPKKPWLVVDEESLELLKPLEL